MSMSASMTSSDLSGVLSLVQSYGFLGLFAAAYVAALGIGVPIPLTALLLALGALSGEPHGPSFAVLALAGLAGTSSGHFTVYSVGRLGSGRIASRLARVRQGSRVQRILDAAARLRGGRALLVFVSRFLLTSIASPVSLVAGATRLALGVYLGLELSGEGLYVLGNLGIGRLFGARLTNGTGGLLLLWLAVAVLTLLPFALLRLLTWRRGQRGLREHPDLPAPSALSSPAPSALSSSASSASSASE